MPAPARIAAVKHHADGIDGGRHFDRLITRERRIVRRLSETLLTMTACAFVGVDALAQAEQKAAFLDRRRAARGVWNGMLRKRLQVDRHGARIDLGHVLQAVVGDVGHRSVDRAAFRDSGPQQVSKNDLSDGLGKRGRLYVPSEQQNGDC